MFKSLFVAITVISASVGFSAQLSWVSDFFTNPQTINDFMGGSAYLIMTSSTSSVTTGQVSNYIATNGLSYSGSEFFRPTLNTPGKMIQQLGYTYIALNSDGDDVANLYDAGTYKGFIVVVSTDNSKYLVSGIDTITINDVTPTSMGELGGPEANWQSGDVGGAAPEPTVLALIALGVAGLALKRRV